MCERCDEQLAYALEQFSGALDHYMEDVNDGNVRATEAMRVHDLANTLADWMIQSPKGFFTTAYMLAVCMDRTAHGVPLNMAPARGVDFRLVVQAVNESRSEAGKSVLEPDDIIGIFDVASTLSSGTTLEDS
jgi:hypothetical protein